MYNLRVRDKRSVDGYALDLEWEIKKLLTPISEDSTPNEQITHMREVLARFIAIKLDSVDELNQLACSNNYQPLNPEY
jgi:hypothetical protein